ncbi:SDR family oxidoreductase [Mesorhizobium sp. WSM2239]|uniref:SDR family oxidoreductase n=2 Tax=unclassified Mesorhizobium TaxID=325217 RepID=A0AAU8DBK2_9HYPH
MQIIVTGATGLIGSAVCTRLSSEGHAVVAVVRSKDSPVSASRTIVIDLAAATRAEDWQSYLAGIDAVVNCAGVLQDSPRESTKGVHVEGIGALFAACEAAGIRRVIHFSAIGVDRGTVSEFSRTKLAGDEALMARDLDWVILRPSVVLGRNASGGSALFRGLAALPWLPVMPKSGPLQVVQLDDILDTVSFFVNPLAPAKCALELGGPEQLAMEDVVARYRAWMGWPAARTIMLPEWAAATLYRLGDFAGSLGWRPAMRSTARKEIARGAVGDPRPWATMTGIEPRSLTAALRAEPASVQERWYARLFFLKPVVFTIFPVFWLVTGIVSLTTGYDAGVDLMRRAGAGVLAAPGVVAGALADILVGLAIAYRPTAKYGLYAALALSLFYLAAATILLPGLWSDPLGALVKIWPILALNLVALAILEER